MASNICFTLKTDYDYNNHMAYYFNANNHDSIYNTSSVSIR